MPDYLVWIAVSILVENENNEEDAINKALTNVENSNLIHEDTEVDSVEELE